MPVQTDTFKQGNIAREKLSVLLMYNRTGMIGREANICSSYLLCLCFADLPWKSEMNRPRFQGDISLIYLS